MTDNGVYVIHALPAVGALLERSHRIEFVPVITSTDTREAICTLL